MRAPSQIKRSKRFFCNQKCAGLWKCKNLTGDKIYNYKGGYDNWSDYGPSWPFARRQARIRDNNTCQICGIKQEALGKKLDVHHIIPFRFIGKEKHKKANRLSNLQTLCPSCHTVQEIKDSEFAQKYSSIIRKMHIIF